MNRIIQKREQLENQITSIDLELSRLPDKQFYCAKNGNSYKWYEGNGRRGKYIPKKKRSYAEKLALRKYLMLLKEDLLQEITAIDFYLRHHNSTGNRAEQLLTNTSAYAELLAPHFKPISQELLEWMNSPYEHNENYPENLIHKTSAGIYVRSKSEALIVMFLHMKKIPFRYECLLLLGDIPFYPDFMIRHPKTGKVYYWEHFGMMNVPEYNKNAFSKMQIYANYGIIPGINFLATYETKEHPLDAEIVEKMIEYYFC